MTVSFSHVFFPQKYPIETEQNHSMEIASRFYIIDSYRYSPVYLLIFFMWDMEMARIDVLRGDFQIITF